MGCGRTGSLPPEVKPLVRAANLDVGFGMVMANAGFYFVVLTSAAALHGSGHEDIETAADAAAALRPLAGSAASLLFALGILGTGLLAIPVLAGSVAYASAELFDWPEGLNETFRRAPQFYAVIILATCGGAGIVFSPLPEIRALYIAAIVNGAIAPVLLVFLMVTAHDRRILGAFRPNTWTLAAGWMTALVMGLAAAGLLITVV